MQAVAEGEAALDALASGTLNVALVDLDAPGVGGPGVGGADAVRLHRFAELMGRGRRLPIVGLTADVGRAQADCGLNVCLVEPVDRARLLDAVCDAAGIRGPAGPPPDETAATADPGAAHLFSHSRSWAALGPSPPDEAARPVAGTDAGGITRALADAAAVFGHLAAASDAGDAGLFHRRLAILRRAARHMAAARAGRTGDPGAAVRDGGNGTWDGRPPEPDGSGWHWVEDADGLRLALAW